MRLDLWPTALDFSRSLDCPSYAFKDADWKQAEITQNKYGKVIHWGLFAAVFKATLPDSKTWAVRVSTSRLLHREHRSIEISKYVNSLGPDSPFYDFKYIEEGIRNVMDGKWYPMLLMEWLVEGVSMFEWVTKQCQASNTAQLLAALLKWVDVMAYLKEHDIAHGDLQHESVMFTANDEIKMVFGLGMCVPSLQGLDALEAGEVPYQHPSRDVDTMLDSTLDYFSSIFIYVAIAALAEAPNLWQQFVLDQDYEKLLFQKEDLESPATSALFSALKTQAPEAYPMCLELADLYNGDIDDVPALERFLQ
jgi:hypothetical protein